YLLEVLEFVVPSYQLKREASDRQQASSNIEELGRALKQQGEPTPPNPALNMSRWPYLGEEELNRMRQEGRIPKSSHVPSDKGGERARGLSPEQIQQIDKIRRGDPLEPSKLPRPSTITDITDGTSGTIPLVEADLMKRTGMPLARLRAFGLVVYSGYPAPGMTNDPKFWESVEWWSWGSPKRPPEAGKEHEVRGLVVTQVIKGTPAYRAGFE